MANIICRIFGHYNKKSLKPLSINDKESRSCIYGKIECSRCGEDFTMSKHWSIVK